ncbi:hypothetical protein [Nonomuraea typhae]|nr:hypothetical protein [Nonomuraea typhae]
MVPEDSELFPRALRPLVRRALWLTLLALALLMAAGVRWLA